MMRYFLRLARLFALGGFLAQGAMEDRQQPVFEDLTGPRGLQFQHVNGMQGGFYLPEITGSGAAFLDYDADGDLDVYLVQSGPFNPSPEEELSDRLFENLLISENSTGRLHFRDVTRKAGIGATGYGMGVASGDVNNDGYPDLYITNLESNQLYLNQGGRGFRDVTASAGVDDTRWSTSAAFLDFDRDGWLDLFVTNYVDFSSHNNPRCYARTTARDYCGPDAFAAQPDRLFRNRGDGTFEDVSRRCGISAEYGAGLGVVSGDFNQDGWIDLYVANDGDPNILWINQGDGTFKNEALLAGVALNGEGLAEAGMGVDAADFDNDGDEDLFVVHLMEETNTLYVNLGKGYFEDQTILRGLAAPSLNYTGFGTGWLDFNSDGRLDLMVLNGAVRTLVSLAQKGDPYPLGQFNQLYRQLEDGTFVDDSVRAGQAFMRLEVSRGAAIGDLDNDGDTDVLMTNSNGPARLLINRQSGRQSWIGLTVRVQGRDALGALVEIRLSNGSRYFRRVRTDGSYCSARDPRILVSLGQEEGPVSARVVWVDGETDEWTIVPSGSYAVLEKWKGDDGR